MARRPPLHALPISPSLWGSCIKRLLAIPGSLLLDLLPSLLLRRWRSMAHWLLWLSLLVFLHNTCIC
jgi:hypothetical protein